VCASPKRVQTVSTRRTATKISTSEFSQPPQATWPCWRTFGTESFLRTRRGFRVFTRSGSLAAGFDQVQLSHLERHIEARLGGRGENVARRPELDRRQEDFFGAPVPAPTTPKHRPTRKPKPERDIKRRSPSSDSEDALSGDSIDVLAARLSSTELNQLAAALSDDDLAHLVIATVRQSVADSRAAADAVARVAPSPWSARPGSSSPSWADKEKMTTVTREALVGFRGGDPAGAAGGYLV